MSSAQFFGELWDCVEEVGNEAEVCDLKDRGFFVFVDRDDDLSVIK